MARPTKYTDDLLDMAYEYLDNWKFNKEGEEIALPSHVGLAMHLNVSRSTMYSWAEEEDKQEFSDILENILEKQQSELINKGLMGVFNPTIAKLVLGKHGFNDNQKLMTDDGKGGDAPLNQSVDVSKLSLSALKELRSLQNESSDTD